jgi:amino acid adenylation domain-containing protein
MQHRYHLTASDVVLQKTPFSFDVSVWEFFWPLLNGARLVVARPDGHRDTAYLREVIEREQVSTIHFVPAMLQAFLADPEVATGCRSLRRVICSGEALSAELAARCLQQLPQAELHNLYGPTEAAVDVTAWQCLSEDQSASVPIGKPISNLSIYILDGEMQPVPIGVSGELYIGGVGLARGYHQRAGLTAEKFIPHPYSQQGGERLYRTGDVARHRVDGEIEYLGRVDHQVKLRGFRIELGEIESVLREHAEVQEAVVLARADGRGEKRLVGYLMVEGGGAAEIEVEEVRQYLKGRLPEYMVPQVMMKVAQWPLTPSGKVDRARLPEPQAGRGQTRVELVAPRTEAEQVLAGVWEEVLGLAAVGVHDNYFALGGDSIRSISLLTLAKERGLSFSIQQLFQYQTIAELAKEGEVNETVYTPAPGIEPFGLIIDEDRLRMPEGVEDAYPLTMLQAGMLYHIEYSPDSSFYHNVSSYHLRARFVEEVLETTVRQLLLRHPVLRTSFSLTGYSEPLQLVHGQVPLPLRVDDLCHLSDEEQERVIAAAIEAEKSLKFDAAQPPLLRFHVHRRTAETFQFTLTEHHAILDGWSAASLLAELFHLYFANLRGDAEGDRDEPPLKGAFRDFVALEREILQSEEARNYWNRKLSGSTVTMMPRWQKPVEAGSTAKLIHREVPISYEVSEALKTMAHTAGVPLKSVLLAAYLRVMSLLSAQQDVVTGIVSHGRPEGADGARVLGLYLNTLPFRLTLSGGTWMDLVRETFAAERELLPYRRYPMAQMQNEQGHALFETFFNFVNFHVYEGIKQITEVEVLGGTAFSDTNYTLSAEFSLAMDSSDITLILSGAASELGGEQMEAMRGYFEMTLAAMSHNPLSRYESVCLLSPAEVQQQVAAWNQTQQEFPSDLCLHHFFEHQVLRSPDSLALRSGEASLSYQQLNERANQLAHHLLSLGVGPESLVGISLARSPLLLISLLAVLKAGAAYLPLDPTYPAARLSFMLDDGGVSVLLTDSEVQANIPATEHLTVLSLDLLDESLSRYSVENPETQVEPRNLAYVIYTSGSTGTPKGVAISHHSASVFLAWAQQEFTRAQLQMVLAATSINFDLSVFELFVPLSVGGTVLLVTDALALAELPESAREQVTLINTVPSAMGELVRLQAVPSSVQVINLAGEALSRSLVSAIYQHVPAVAVYNLYGPSEDTTYSTWGRVADEPEARVTIGRPIANTQVYLLDRELQVVPVGVSGELYLGGEGLARGYLKRAELTAEKFIPDPFAAGRETGGGGGRLYRTGDLARYLEDGEIEYLGRADSQVKLRGYRIELGEIEEAVRRHAGVGQCAVMIREDVVGEKRLVAYVELAEGQAVVETGELRELLKERLPDYMMPSVFVWLAEMPLTQNGKVDRKRLPAPEQTREAVEADFVTPRTATQEVLAGIWAQVLGVERAGIRDDFFELGGHSLLATQIISRVRETFHVEIPLRSLFGAPTVEGLAGYVEEALRGASVKPLPPLVPVARSSELPLSFAQQRLWFFDQVTPGSPAFNIAEAIRLNGPLSVSALEQTLNEVMRRHEALRTTFPTVEGQARQVIAPALNINMQVIDLCELPPDVRESEARQLAEQEAQKPFDLGRGPLVRAALVRLNEEEHVVLLTMHHIISDAWSIGVLVREVAALYEAFLRGESSTLPELPVQYADFAHWQREWLQGETLDAHLAYWKEQLAGAPPLLEMKTDRPRRPEPSFNGARYSFSFSEPLTQSLKTLSRQEGSTLFMTLLSAYQILLHHNTGQSDITVGTDVANRNRVEVEPLIGFFINQLALRATVSPAASYSEMLGHVRDVTLGAYAHQDLPFDRLVDGLKVERTTRYPPLFQVKLVFQNAPLPPLQLPGLSVSSMGINSGMSRFDLQLSLWEEAGILRGWFEYNSDLFDAATITRLSEDLTTILERVVMQPNILIRELDLILDEAHRQREAVKKEESKDALAQKYKTVRRKAISVAPGRES